jgi:uncharacterized OB-fold protein
MHTLAILAAMGTVTSATRDVLASWVTAGLCAPFVLVDLDEGFRMMSRVDGVPAEKVEVGTKVRLRVDREGDDPVPVFVPADEDR